MRSRRYAAQAPAYRLWQGIAQVKVISFFYEIRDRHSLNIVSRDDPE